MKALFERLRARFGETVGGMSARDRNLFVGLIIAGYLVMVGGTFWLLRGVAGDARSRVASREETLALVQALASDQAEAADSVASIENELKRNATVDLPSFIEKSAQSVGISANLSGVREKATTATGTLEEKTYGVELVKLSLAQLVDFLHEVETSKYPLKVRSLKAKTQTSAGVKVLNVTLEMSAFRLLESAEVVP